ncbi:MAG: Ig-like domain-containing protein, partial [Anaerolineaceae bacterium]
AQISPDNGASWKPLALNPEGNWSYTWDLTQASNGKHTLLVRAADLAGNLGQVARITVVVANLGPSISITKSWWLYQTADVKMAGGVLPISGARIVVSDGGTHTRTYNYSRGSLPSQFQWNGIWDDGTKVGPGKYQVAAAAWDILGTDAHAVGSVHVPYPIPTPTRTATLPSTPPPTRITVPSQAPIMRTPPAPIRTPVVSVVRPVPPKAPKPTGKPRPLWPVTGLVALLAALASASLSDPRPRALRALGKTLEQLQGKSN